MSEVTRVEYYNDVASIAADLIARCRAGEITDLHDALHEECDGNQWVIYTYHARKCLEFSGNEDAGPDDLGWDDFSAGVSSMGDLYTRAAFYALQADVLEAMDDGDFDPNDEDSWTEVDDECDEDASDGGEE